MDFASDELEAWDKALNQSLGRSLVAPSSDHVLQGMVKEVAQMLAATRDETLSGAVTPLRQALGHTGDLNRERLCLRKEAVQALAGEYVPHLDAPVLVGPLPALPFQGGEPLPGLFSPITMEADDRKVSASVRSCSRTSGRD